MACTPRRRRTALTVLFVAIAAAAAVGWRRRAARHGEQHADPAWPAFEPAPPTDHLLADDAGHGGQGGHGGPPARWLAPVDGQCPDGYPVKANDNSGIFHVPGGRFYTRTVPERCYATGEDAEADGYRRAKA